MSVYEAQVSVYAGDHLIAYLTMRGTYLTLQRLIKRLAEPGYSTVTTYYLSEPPIRK